MNDAGSTQVVYAAIAGLIVIGLVLIGLAVFVARRTRIDRVALAPLEVMGERRWRSRDPMTQRRLLDEARPTGAEPLRPTPGEPAIDAEFAETDRPVPSFDDLQDVALAPPDAAAAPSTEVAVPDPVPAVAEAAGAESVEDEDAGSPVPIAADAEPASREAPADDADEPVDAAT